MTKRRASTGAYASAVTAYKRQLVARALADAGGNVTHAAAALGLQRTYLHRLIRQLEVTYALPPETRHVDRRP